MLNFWVKKPKNRDFDPVVPISGRVNIKILNCYILKPPQKIFWRIRGGGARMTSLAPGLYVTVLKYSKISRFSHGYDVTKMTSYPKNVLKLL